MSQDLDITKMLNAIGAGDNAAQGELYSKIYQELRMIARSHRARWRGDDTLSATALINEAYLKLAGGRKVPWSDRHHFYATAAKAMRQVLVSYSEGQQTAKRGGGAVRVPLAEDHLVDEITAAELLTVHRALEHLEGKDPRGCRVVECRVFGGMSLEETAHALDVSLSTVKRDWASASLDLADLLEADRAGRDPDQP